MKAMLVGGLGFLIQAGPWVQYITIERFRRYALGVRMRLEVADGRIKGHGVHTCPRCRHLGNQRIDARVRVELKRMRVLINAKLMNPAKKGAF